MMPVTELEEALARKIFRASLRVGSNDKRFVRRIVLGEIQQLADGGRQYLALIAHRYRRQYKFTLEELEWLNVWMDRERERV